MRVFIARVYEKLDGGAARFGGFALYAFVLFLVMSAAYNLQIGRLGFYYDDWEGVFLQKESFSAGQIWQYFLRDRPFSALTHLIFNPLVGARPLGWRVLGQTLNWLAALFFVKTLLNIWPKRVFEIAWIGLLLAVYPGIARQFVVRTSIPHYTSMLLFTLSLWLMVKAVAQPRRAWRLVMTAVAVLLGVLQMLIIEYFAGIELIRGLLLFTIFRRAGLTVGRAIRKTLAAWLPYAFGFVVFLVYHLAALPRIQAPGMEIKNQPLFFSQLLADPGGTIVRYAQVVIQDLAYALVYVWSRAIAPDEIVLQSRIVLLSWLVGAAAAGLAALAALAWRRRAVNADEKEPYPWLATLMCAAALLLGGLPVWIIGQQGSKGIWAGRFLFGPVLGVAPLVVLFIGWAAGQARRGVQSVLLAALLAGSLALQIRTANKYALNWGIQRDYYWQLKWRAPVLQAGTFILSPYTPFTYNDDYQIAYAINVLYAPGNAQTNARYWWLDGPDQGLYERVAGLYIPEQAVDLRFRTLTFQSDMRHALGVFFRPARGCLQVVSAAYQNQPGLLAEESALYSVLNEGLINEGELDIPLDVFGPEPRHDWCYYFQKGDLAREMGQWEQAFALWQAASAQGLKPKHLPEYLPFLESSMRAGHWQQAAQITQAAAQGDDMAPFLCAAWSRVTDSLPDTAEEKENWDALKTQLECLNPRR